MSKSQPSFGAALQYAIEQFGGPVSEAEAIVPVSGGVVPLILGNGDRLGILFINVGNADVYVSFTPSILFAGGGIYLPAAGGLVSMIVRDDLTLPSRAWYATNVTGASSVYTLEYFRISQ